MSHTTHSILPKALTGHMPMLKATAVASDEQLQHLLQSAIAPASCTVPYPPSEALCAALDYQPAMELCMDQMVLLAKLHCIVLLLPAVLTRASCHITGRLIYRRCQYGRHLL